MRVSWTVDLIREEFRSRNIKLLSTEYKNNKEHILVQCMVGGCDCVWPAMLNNVVDRNTGCPRCSGHEKTSNESVDWYINKHKIQIKRIENVTSVSKAYNWLCLKCNNEIKTMFFRIRHYDDNMYGCKKCRGIGVRVTNEEYDKRLLDNNIPIKRIEDLNGSMMRKVSHECLICGHSWRGTPSNIQNEHCGCPNCNIKKGERFVGEVLREILPDVVNWQYPLFFNNRKYLIDYEVEIDGKQYFIEYNGGQHYFPVKLWGGEDGFMKQQKRDSEIVEYCEKNNIKLIIIKYDMKRNEIITMLHNLFDGYL